MSKSLQRPSGRLSTENFLLHLSWNSSWDKTRTSQTSVASSIYVGASNSEKGCIPQLGEIADIFSDETLTQKPNPAKIATISLSSFQTDILKSLVENPELISLMNEDFVEAAYSVAEAQRDLGFNFGKGFGLEARTYSQEVFKALEQKAKKTNVLPSFLKSVHSELSSLKSQSRNEALKDFPDLF